jgi:hypothetical protein
MRTAVLVSSKKDPLVLTSISNKKYYVARNTRVKFVMRKVYSLISDTGDESACNNDDTHTLAST